MEGRTEFGAPPLFCCSAWGCARALAPGLLRSGWEAVGGRHGAHARAPARLPAAACLVPLCPPIPSPSSSRRWKLESLPSASSIVHDAVAQMISGHDNDPVAFFGHLGDRRVVG